MRIRASVADNDPFPRRQLAICRDDADFPDRFWLSAKILHQAIPPLTRWNFYYRREKRREDKLDAYRDGRQR